MSIFTSMTFQRKSMAEQKAGGFSTKYRFTGKELDPLSGLYDFGARYYDPRLSVWFGVDPLAQKYPSISPYTYVANNPILYLDNDGREIWISIVITDDNGTSGIQLVQYKNNKLYDASGKTYQGNNDFAVKVQNDLNKLSEDDKALGEMINDLSQSDQIHVIEMTDKATDGNSNTPLSSQDDKNGNPTGSLTKYNPDKQETVKGDKRSPRVGLTHELLGHGRDSDKGKTDYSKTSNGIPMYEVNAVNVENIARSTTGDPKRTEYGGKPIPPELLIDPPK